MDARSEGEAKLVFSIRGGGSSSFEHFLDEVQAEKCSIEQFRSEIRIAGEIKGSAVFRRRGWRFLAGSAKIGGMKELETHCRATSTASSSEMAMDRFRGSLFG